MEAGLQRHDRVVRRAWRLVAHTSKHFLLGRELKGTTALTLSVVEHCQLESTFVCTSATHGESDALHIGWRVVHECRLVNLGLLLEWIDTDASARANNHLHEFVRGDVEHCWVVVADCVGANRTEHVEQSVSISVLHIVSKRVLQIDWEVCLEVAADFAELFLVLDGLGRGESSLHVWPGGLVWEGASTDRKRCSTPGWHNTLPAGPASKRKKLEVAGNLHWED